MPYIKQKEREKYKELINQMIELLEREEEKDIDGSLNYVVSSILKKLYKPKYFNYNRAMGVLECIKQEFYRKQVASYEEEKIKENGDLE